MEKCKSVTTPAEVKSEVEDASAPLGREDHALYRRILGKVMYAASVRPDVAFVVKELARRLAGPTRADWNRARRLL
eukprot:10024076-Heterocapsa_arctica.AAC.1